MDINIQFREEGNLLLGLIEGEIDTFTAPILREELEKIELSNEISVELDLSKVSYMYSTGLGVFVAFYKRATKEDVNLKLVNLSTRLTRLFEITGLSELMDIERGGIGHASI